MSHIQQTISPPAPNDIEAMDWAARVVANGGTSTAAMLSAVATFVRAAKASAYWTKLNRLNLFCGNQLAACLVPLKVGGGNATDTNMNFVSGDYTPTTGLTGNATTKYLKTGLIPSASLTLNDTHMAVYNRAASAAGGGLTMGVRTSPSFFDMLAPHTTADFFSRQYDDPAVALQAVCAFPAGFLVGSRVSSATHKIYRNGTALQTQVAASAGSLLGREMYVFASNDTGSPVLRISHPLAAYSVGSGLTDADVTAYNTHLQAFQLAMGRNV